MVRILIVAHQPPPFHGQSLIVRQVLEKLPHTVSGANGASAQKSIKLIHLNLRLSSDIDDIGRWGMLKLVLLGWYMVQLVFLSLVHRPHAAYYVPSPGKRISVYRDFAVLGFMRILGIPRVLHWLAGGLSEWVQTRASASERFFCHFSYEFAALSIIPVESERANAQYFQPEKLVKILNGIPDPCENFDSVTLPQRLERLERRRLVLQSLNEHELGRGRELGELDGVEIFQVLFMGHCTADKGLFDTMDAVVLANRKMEAAGQPIRFFLRIIGKFMTADAESRFSELAKSPAWEAPLDNGPAASLLSFSRTFISGEEKAAVFLESDVLCLPSYYAAEATPTVIIDALAHGLPVISTNWRGIPELLPPDGLPLCQIKRPDQIADRLISAVCVSNFSSYRSHYLSNFSLAEFQDRLREAIRSLIPLPDSPS